jgi:3-oxoacyl-[acyl-carrier-protein] synthase II
MNPGGHTADTAVAITGMGAVTPFGIGIEPFWQGLVAGIHRFTPIELFDTGGHRTRLAAQAGALPAPAVRRLDANTLSRADRMALLAASECLAEAGCLHPQSGRVTDPERTAVIVGTAAGGILGLETFFRCRHNKQRVRHPETLLSSFCLSALATNLAREFGIRGERRTIATVCSSSGLALAAARDLIMDEDTVDQVLVVGAESLSEVTHGGFNSLRAIDPSVCRPFDIDRRGLVLGEGAGALLLERPGTGSGRAACGALLGYGLTTDLHHFTAPEPGGRAVRDAITAALAEAGLFPAAIGYVNAHGTGTPHNDVAESRGILAALGDAGESAWVSSIKSMIGHTLGAASILEAIATLMAMEHGLLPPTAGLARPDERCALRLVGTAPQPAACTRSLSNSFAFGGSNISIALAKRPPSSDTTTAAAPPQEAVVTGVGLVSALGIGLSATRATLSTAAAIPSDLGLLDQTWKGVRGGLVDRGSVREMVPPPLRRRLNRQGLYLYAALTEALGQAGLASDTPPPMDISYASAFGCSGNVHRFFTTLLQEGPRFASPYEFNFSVANAPPAMIAQLLGIRGAIWVFAADDLSFEVALENAVRRIRSGRAQRVLVCAAEEISTSVLSIHRALGLLDAPDRPALVPGEGAVCMVLESMPAVLARSGSVLGKVIACNLVQDAASAPLCFSKDVRLLARAAEPLLTGNDPQGRILVTDPCNHLAAVSALWESARTTLERWLRQPPQTLAVKPMVGESGLGGGIAMAVALAGQTTWDTLLALNCGRGGTAAAIRMERSP